MNLLTCKACGAPLDVKEGQKIVECKYCDLQQTLPQMDDDFKVQMFNQANELRRRFDFDGAKAFLQAVTSRYPEEAEAYWGICLCKYGIMYVEDQQTFKQIPTFYRMIPQSILTDENYLNACKYSLTSKWKYEDEASKIDSLQKKILQLSSTDEPYDIFICYKKTDPLTGMLTKDSDIAGQLYMKLIENGYKVFWADRSLPAGCEYEPYIYSALSTAKIMLILSSNKEYFEATWVKNEWVRFLDMMSRDSGKSIITCYQNMSAEDIPSSLKNLQAMDMSSMLFSSDLLEQIKKKLPKSKKEYDTAALFEAFKSFRLTNEPSDQQRATQTSSDSKELNINDCIYKGDAIAGKPHGYGELHFPNGSMFAGHWNVGKKHGKGKFTYEDGSSWTGEWKHDEPINGEGKLRLTLPPKWYNFYLAHAGANKIDIERALQKHFDISENEAEDFVENGGFLTHGMPSADAIRIKNDLESRGATVDLRGGKQISAIYEGKLENGKLVGPGKIYHNGTLVEEGTFEDGKLNGEGTTCTLSGKTCKGEFVNGVPWNAVGTHDIILGMSYASYTGSWVEGRVNGQGTLCLRTGDVIEGVFENGFNGNVKWRSINWTYEGPIKNFANCGKGKFMDATGFCIYSGDFENGTYNGLGIHYFKNGNRYEGEFKDGLYHGKGVFIYPQGNWIGEWKNGLRHKGKGLIIYYDAGGRPTGQFYNGYMVNGVAAGKGILRLADGSRFDGEFLDDKYYNGTLYNASNAVIDTFVNGQSQTQQKSSSNSIASSVLKFISKL